MIGMMYDYGTGESKARRPPQLSAGGTHISRHLARLITTAALVPSITALYTEQAEV